MGALEREWDAAATESGYGLGSDSLWSVRSREVLKVLVVDDQPAVGTALQVLFEIHGLECVVADGPEAALAAVQRERLGVVVQDMNFTEDTTSGEEGVRLFRDIKAADPDLPVLLMTAWTSLESAVQLVKEGASDYIAKPWDDARLIERVQSLLRLRESRLEAVGREAQGSLAQRYDLCGLIYGSARMHDVVTLSVKVAAAEVPVLITGANGTGKEKIAEIIQANSGRKRRAFVRVNSGALPEQLVETELFGCEAGAYTGANKRRMGRFEAANGGTIFLDEIGNLSLGGQMKLLRVLQTGEFERVGSSVTQRVDVRVISATNSDLKQGIAEGTFREDLYFRLNVIEIKAPPLTERREDMWLLATHFLGELTPAHDSAPVLDDGARATLMGHDWPGNIRGLRNCMQRAALLCQDGRIRSADLGLVERAPVPVAKNAPPVSPPSDLLPADPERARIEQALLRARGTVSRAAAELGMSRQALYRRMERHGIVLERRPKGG